MFWRRLYTPFSLPPNGRQRSFLRGLLHSSRRGNHSSFLQLADHYLDFLSESVAVRGYSPGDSANREVERILLTGWRCLSCLRRVSDFERFLVLQLERLPEGPSRFPIDHPSRRVQQCEPRLALLFVARELEGWSPEHLALSFRQGRRKLSRDLLHLRCCLTQHPYDLSCGKVRLWLREQNRALDTALSPRRQRLLYQALQNYGEVRLFKSKWLALRCDLMDWRQSLRLEEEDRFHFLQRLRPLLEDASFLRVGWLASIFNQVKFSRLPEGFFSPQR